MKTTVICSFKDEKNDSPMKGSSTLLGKALASQECESLTCWNIFIVAVQLLNRVQLFATPWPATCQAALSTTSQSLLKFTSVESLIPPSSFALNLSQHQSLLQWVGSSHQSVGASASASVLPMNIQGWFPLGLTGLISLQSKGLSRVFSNTTVQKHQFFCL